MTDTCPECSCGCGLPLPKGRRKFASDVCSNRFHNAVHNPKRYVKYPGHYHPCNSGESERCYAKKTGKWKAPNPYIRTCPACRDVLQKMFRKAGGFTDEAVMADI